MTRGYQPMGDVIPISSDGGSQVQCDRCPTMVKTKSPQVLCKQCYAEWDARMIQRSQAEAEADRLLWKARREKPWDDELADSRFLGSIKNPGLYRDMLRGWKEIESKRSGGRRRPKL